MLRDVNGHGWFLHASDIGQLAYGAIRGHLDVREPDAILNIETHLYDVRLTAESCRCDFDVGKHLWLNRSRWTRLLRDYLNPERLTLFLDQARLIYNGEARCGATTNMLMASPVRSPKKHRWGGCMMGMTFRSDGYKHSTLTLYSRTTYMGYIGLLDMAVAHCIARAITPELDTVGFRWHISSQQLHCFKTLPYIYSQPDLMKRLEQFTKRRRGTSRRPPTWVHIVKWYRKVLEHYAKWGVNMLDYEKYGPFRRIKRRWLEYKGYLKKNVPPSLPVSELTFEAIGL